MIDSILPAVTIKLAEVAVNPVDIFIDVAVNLAASLFWLLLALFCGASWYWFRSRKKEAVWIRSHGKMLFVYFRNIDWRCNRMRNFLPIKPQTSCEITQSIRLELVKLQADLDALDRLTAMWSRRMDGIPFWHPYAAKFQRMLDAQAELHATLLRHTVPMLSLLECTENQPSHYIQPLTSLLDELNNYGTFFVGGRERLWAGGQRGVADNIRDIGSPALVELKDIRLANRLHEFLESMLVLLNGIGNINTEEIWIWRQDENKKDIWFLTMPPS